MNKNFVLISLLFYVTLCQAKIAPYSFLYYRDLKAPETLENEIASFVINDSLYLHTEDYFSNIRLYSKDNKEIPFIIRHITSNDTITYEPVIHLSQHDFKRNKDNSIEVIYKRDKKDSIPVSLTLETSKTNFEKMVTVYGSNNIKKWTVLVEKQPIFDYEKYIDVRNLTVSFDKKPFIYYKIHLNNITEIKNSPFTQIFAEYDEREVKRRYKEFYEYKITFHINNTIFKGKYKKLVYGKKVLKEYPLLISETIQDTTDKTTNTYLGSNRQPLNKISLKVNTKNFKRKIKVEGTNDTTDDPTWYYLGNTEIYDVTAGDFHKEKMDIDLNRTGRFTKYRIKIYDHDNLPITFSSVSAIGDIHEILFFHNNISSLKVYYGGNDIPAPKYDVSSVLAEAPPIKGSLWELGKEYRNIEKPLSTKRQLLKPIHILYGALALMIIVLLCVLVFTVKKVDEKIKP